MSMALEKWKHQHLSRPDWAEMYFASQGLPSRSLVLAGLKWIEPWTSLAELGCNSGPMLQVIHQAYGQAHLTGVEPNHIALDAAKTSCPYLNPYLGSLQEWLSTEPTVDVLVSHYTLAYLSPEEIRPILAQMCSVAKRGLVLAEPMGEEKLIWSWPEWSHDYLGHLISLGKEEFAEAPVSGVGNLNSVLACRW